MNLIVLTPEKELFCGEITSVKVPGTKGQFEILKVTPHRFIALQRSGENH